MCLHPERREFGAATAGQIAREPIPSHRTAVKGRLSFAQR
jgi:hypothetical protein